MVSPYGPLGEVKWSVIAKHPCDMLRPATCLGGPAAVQRLGRGGGPVICRDRGAHPPESGKARPAHIERHRDQRMPARRRQMREGRPEDIGAGGGEPGITPARAAALTLPLARSACRKPACQPSPAMPASAGVWWAVIRGLLPVLWVIRSTPQRIIGNILFCAGCQDESAATSARASATSA